MFTILVLCKHCGQTKECKRFSRRGVKPIYCSAKCKGKAQYQRRKHHLLAPRPKPQKCKRCQRSFLDRSRYLNRLYCWRCSGVRSRKYRQSAIYKINGMHPAEFCFQILMERKGTPVERLPAIGIFLVNGYEYTPDFIDRSTNTYYEVIGTRQAYHQQKDKIVALRKARPEIVLKVVRPDGTEILP